MFVYGIPAGPGDKHERIAEPALRRFAPDGHIIVRRGQTSIFEAYNAVLDAAAALPDVEGVVLLHDDVELRADVEPELRAVLADPSVGVVGTVGARNCGFEWWSGEKFGRVEDAASVEDYGGGRHEVDAVDGLLLALSPWAVKNLRFDERRFRGFHGYDRDICSQARRKGRKVIVAELPVMHHSAVGATHSASFEDARLTWQMKWDPSVNERARAAVRRRRLRAGSG